jgi:hypothetical protein
LNRFMTGNQTEDANRPSYLLVQQCPYITMTSKPSWSTQIHFDYRSAWPPLYHRRWPYVLRQRSRWNIAECPDNHRQHWQSGPGTCYPSTDLARSCRRSYRTLHLRNKIVVLFVMKWTNVPKTIMPSEHLMANAHEDFKSSGNSGSW